MKIIDIHLTLVLVSGINYIFATLLAEKMLLYVEAFMPGCRDGGATCGLSCIEPARYECIRALVPKTYPPKTSLAGVHPSLAKTQNGNIRTRNLDYAVTERSIA